MLNESSECKHVSIRTRAQAQSKRCRLNSPLQVCPKQLVTISPIKFVHVLAKASSLSSITINGANRVLSPMSSGTTAVVCPAHAFDGVILRDGESVVAFPEVGLRLVTRLRFDEPDTGPRSFYPCTDP